MFNKFLYIYLFSALSEGEGAKIYINPILYLLHKRREMLKKTIMFILKLKASPTKEKRSRMLSGGK